MIHSLARCVVESLCFLGFMWFPAVRHTFTSTQFKDWENPQPSCNLPQASRGPFWTCLGLHLPSPTVCCSSAAVSFPAADSPGILPLWRSLRVLLSSLSWDMSLMAYKKWGKAGGSARPTCGLHAWAAVCDCLCKHKHTGLRLSLAPRRKEISFISSIRTDQMKCIVRKQRQTDLQPVNLTC